MMTMERAQREAAAREAQRNPLAGEKTLRDDFAGLAMQAVIARGDDTNRPGMAEWSYAMADAMLKARTA